ncbi:hypothetical protein ACWF82_06160 [Nocardia sp. NPDC055053]
MAVRDSGDAEQQADRPETLVRWHPVIDGQCREQRDAVGSTRLAGVLMDSPSATVALQCSGNREPVLHSAIFVTTN